MCPPAAEKKLAFKIIGNAKKFMAYDIIKLLEENKRHELLHTLSHAVTANEKRKGNCTGYLKTSLMSKQYFLKNFYCKK